MCDFYLILVVLVDVLIIYERKQRELENAILLQIELEKRGFSCEITQFYEAAKFNIFNVNPPKVILSPHLYNTKSVYRNFARFGHAKFLVNLQYEQVLSKKWEELGAHTPKGLAQNFYHICWGDKIVKRLIEGKVPEGNVKVFAPLHLDLLRAEYRPQEALIKEELSRRYRLDIKKEWVLFLSSFTYADIELDRLKINEAAAGIDLSDFPVIHSKSRNKLLDWFREILSKDGNKLFIYRPHPDELSIEQIEQIEQEYSNFCVIRDEAVKTWISASDVIYSWYSTSVVEAHFLGKPYSILRPYVLPDSFDSVLLKHGKFIESYTEFEADYFLNNEVRQFAIDDIYIKKYYQVNPTVATHKVFSDFLENLIKSEQRQKIAPFDYKEYAIAKIKVLAVYPIYVVNKLLNRAWVMRIFGAKGLFALLSTEMNNQIASDSEKEKIKAHLKKMIN